MAWRVFLKIVDMSHLMNVHNPGWVGYAGNARISPNSSKKRSA
jgi:hypothetical protein